MAETFAEFRAPIPTVSKVVTHPVYLRVAPLALLTLLITANLALPRAKPRLVGLGLISLLGIAAVIVGRYGATVPFTALASLIE